MTNHFFIPDPTEWGPVDGLRLGSARCLSFMNRAAVELDGSERVILTITAPGNGFSADIWVGHLAGCMEWASQMTPANARYAARYELQRLLHKFLLERLILFHASGGANQ